MHKISISPVTRANAVGSVTVLVEKGKVIEAKNEGSIFRGFEIMLEGRHPKDAPYLTQRICGICSSAHGLASSRALENLAGVEPPPNAVLLRNIIFGLDLLQNHLRHFYMLGLWDWVSPPPEPPFSGGYTRDFRLSTTLTEQLWDHYWQAANRARLAHEALSLLGGKVPHNHGIIPGGVSFFPQGNVIMELRSRMKKLKAFIEEVYLPDALLLQDSYADYMHIGQRRQDYLSFGLFPEPGGTNYYYPPGFVQDGRKEEKLDLSQLEESLACSYYQGQGGHPHKESTKPDLSDEKAYSWIKAPRYQNTPCEGGPLVRANLKNTGIYPVNSVMDRILARAREALDVAYLLPSWLTQLRPKEAYYLDFNLPAAGQGIGATEAMRGPLSHWITVTGGRIENYQIITPSSWNFSPQDQQGQPGPAEEALVGTPVEDTAQPVEIGRVIRSFDPCYACSAHVVDLTQNKNHSLQVTG